MYNNRTKQLEDLLLNFHNARQKVISQGQFLNAGADITFSQWIALEIVGRSKKASIDEIAKALQTSSSAATQLISSLKKKGFVTKKIGSDDRRFSAIELSPKAGKLFKAMKKKKIMHVKKLFSNFTDEELSTFIMLIKKITLNV
jgi:DNA-binding MarR family transcriptional regulator